MGYTTVFKGRLEFDRPVDRKLADYLNAFEDARHVTRDIERYKKANPEWESHCFNGDPGTEGEYVADESMFGPSEHMLDDYGVTDYNTPPGSCPGLWCQWVVKDDKYLAWDGAEKFYKYEEWLEYLIENFIAPSGYILNGNIRYFGEDDDDYGTLAVNDNEITKLPHELLDIDAGPDDDAMCEDLKITTDVDERLRSMRGDDDE